MGRGFFTFTAENLKYGRVLYLSGDKTGFEPKIVNKGLKTWVQQTNSRKRSEVVVQEVTGK